MKKLVLSAMLSAFVLSAFGAGAFSTAYACDGKNHDKTNANNAATKKQDKKSDETAGAAKSDQKS
jgi:hypothetical protein